MPFALEMATYPDKRLIRQLVRDAMLVFLNREVLPEVIGVILRPRGKRPVATQTELVSPLDGTACLLKWRIVKLWELPSEDLLATGDVGLVPWIPLTRFSGPPGPVIEQCRHRIDEQAPAEERLNLLAVTQVLMRLRYNKTALFRILGGEDVMIESPLIQDLVSKTRAEATTQTRTEAILDVLESRFGSRPLELADELRSLDEDRLKSLNRYAAVCPDLASFRGRIHESE